MSNLEQMQPKMSVYRKERTYAFLPADQIPYRHALVGISYPDPDYRIFRNADTHINVFEYVLEGEGEICIGGMWKKVKSGDIYILREQEEHQYRSDSAHPYKKMWINYTASYISAYLDAYHIQSGIYTSETARQYFELALETAKYGNKYSESCFTIAECVHKIIHLVAASINASKNADEYKIREALDASVYEKINLDTVASNLHISKSNLIRVFKKNYGVTPYEYLLTLKTETAKILLRETTMSVKEIADRLCISDEHYFSSLFFARVGMRPREYRTKKS